MRGKIWQEEVKSVKRKNERAAREKGCSKIEKGLGWSVYMLLGVEAMQIIDLRLYGQAKEGRQNVFIFLHGVLVMEISITSDEPV